MSMIVHNNLSAVHTLNLLNQNNDALQKSLTNVASGMKINSAQDDASAYAISERLRVRIRALDQANQNTQNDSALMKTAKARFKTPSRFSRLSRRRRLTPPTTATPTKTAGLFKRKSTSSLTKSTTTPLSNSTASISSTARKIM